MQVITYFEVNENTLESERLAGAGKIMEKGLFSPEGVNVLSWIATPDLWRASVPGFFKTTKTAPAMPVQEIIPLTGEINQGVNG